MFYQGGGEGFSSKPNIQSDLEGWREVLLFLSSLLKWDRSYYPAIILGSVTCIFTSIWLLSLSTVTAVSLLLMLAGVVDFAVPYLGPNITGYNNWTAKEEIQFKDICDQISMVQNDVMDIFIGLSYMRQQNAKMFFVLSMVTLTVCAWVGSLMDNLLLVYLIVSMSLLLPGLRHSGVADCVLTPAGDLLSKVKSKVKAA